MPDPEDLFKDKMGLTRVMIILIVFLVGGCSHMPARVDYALDGVWMDESYIRVLQASLSPKAASSVTDIPVLRIDRDKKTLTVLYKSFHEIGYYAIKHINHRTGEITLRRARVSGLHYDRSMGPA